MAQDKISQLEDWKSALERDISQKEHEMRELSRRVSDIQVEILSLKGELKGVLKMLKSLKEK